MIASMASIRFGLPVVKTEHGAGPDIGLAAVMSNKESAARLLEIAALRLCSANIAFVSKDLADSSSRWSRNLITQVVPNGVAIGKARSSRPPELPLGRFNVLFAGRLDPIKAPTVALHAMALLSSESRAYLTIIGDGPLAKEMSILASHPELKTRVQMLGFRSDAIDFVQHADTVILPSLHEGLPYIALEALASGTPLIASEVGGLREHFRHRQTVYFMKPGDDRALADAIVELENNVQLRNDLIAAGLLLVTDKLSVRQMADQYLRIYQEAVMRRR
jgi:glycosyltransferase involved in cell wall biosynthesis